MICLTLTKISTMNASQTLDYMRPIGGNLCSILSQRNGQSENHNHWNDWSRHIVCGTPKLEAFMKVWLGSIEIGGFGRISFSISQRTTGYLVVSLL